MQRFVGTIATTAALVALVTGLWRGDDLLTTLKRTAISYLVFYGVSALLALVFRTGIIDEMKQSEADREEARRRGEREAARRRGPRAPAS